MLKRCPGEYQRGRTNCFDLILKVGDEIEVVEWDSSAWGRNNFQPEGHFMGWIWTEKDFYTKKKVKKYKLTGGFHISNVELSRPTPWQTPKLAPEIVPDKQIDDPPGNELEAFDMCAVVKCVKCEPANFPSSNSS